jgi:hypothetical protein
VPPSYAAGGAPVRRRSRSRQPVETFTQTEERTALTYFTKPLADQFEHAFREN